MRKSPLIIILIILAMILVACDTGDTTDQVTSAQSLQPNFAGFRVESGDNVIQTFGTTVAASATFTGAGVPVAAAIERVSTTLECLTDAGAISGNVYIQENPGIIPQTGLSIVINQNRVERNILSCAADLPFSAQALEDFETCAQSGSFDYESDKFYYFYAGVGNDLCNGFRTHYATYNPTVSQ